MAKKTPASSTTPSPAVTQAAGAVTLPSWFNQKDYDKQQDVYYGYVPLDRIRVSDEIKDIRGDKAYTKNALAGIMKSIEKFGLRKPLNVALATTGDHVLVSGGNRRFTAASALAEEGKIAKNTPIKVFLHAVYDAKNFAADSSLDNKYLKLYDEMADYRNVKYLDSIRHTIIEIVDIAELDKRKVERFLSIAGYEVLEELLDGGMPYSKCAIISEYLDKKPNLVEGTLAFLRKWIDEDAKAARKAKEKEAADKGRDINEEALQFGKLLKPGEFEGWKRDLEAGKVPDGKPKTAKVIVTVEKGIAKVSGISINYEKCTWAEIAEVIAIYKGKAIPELMRVMELLKKADARQELDGRLEDIRRELGLAESEETDEEKTVSEEEETEEQESFEEDDDTEKKPKPTKKK